MAKRHQPSAVDYAPLQAPPNPNDDKAKEAMREYMRPLLVAVQENINDTPHLADGQIISEQNTICGINSPDQMDDSARIAAALARWPDLARYAATARVGRGMVWDAEQQRGVERDGMLVIEVEGEYHERNG